MILLKIEAGGVNSGYYKEVWSPFSPPSVTVVIKGNSKVVELVLKFHHNDSYIFQSRCSGGVCKDG